MAYVASFVMHTLRHCKAFIYGAWTSPAATVVAPWCCQPIHINGLNPTRYPRIQAHSAFSPFPLCRSTGFSRAKSVPKRSSAGSIRASETITLKQKTDIMRNQGVLLPFPVLIGKKLSFWPVEHTHMTWPRLATVACVLFREAAKGAVHALYSGRSHSVDSSLLFILLCLCMRELHA